MVTRMRYLFIFDDNSTTNFEGTYDAQKYRSQSPLVPTMYAMTDDNVEVMQDALPSITADEEIPLGVTVETTGDFTFDLYEVLNIDPTSLIILEDRANGVFHDLRTGTYTANYR